MAVVGTRLDAIGTSNSDLLQNKTWTGFTRKHYGIHLLTSSYNIMESGPG